MWDFLIIVAQAGIFAHYISMVIFSMFVSVLAREKGFHNASIAANILFCLFWPLWVLPEYQRSNDPVIRYGAIGFIVTVCLFIVLLMSRPA